VGTLVAVILSFVALDTTTPINCQALITFQVTFGLLGLVAASLLIIFRIVAIWNKNSLVVGTAITVWATNFSFIILGIARMRASWDPILQECMVLNTEKDKFHAISILISDTVLLLIVLIGLLRLHDSGGTFALGRLLWKQGVIWLLIATVAEVPPAVFVILNLNASLNLMFQLPSLIAMAIAATRIYRNLADFTYGSTDLCFFLRFLYLLRSLSSMICRAFDSLSLQIRDGKITRTTESGNPPRKPQSARLR